MAWLFRAPSPPSNLAPLTLARCMVQCRALLSASNRSVNSSVPRAAVVRVGRWLSPYWISL